MRGAIVFCALLGCGGGSSTPADGPNADGPPNADAPRADAPAPDAAPDAPGPDAGPFTVTGHLLDVDHQPVAGKVVHTAGQTATSDASGAFTFAGLTPPYDLTVWDPDGTNGPFSAPAVTIYLGLTRPDPAIVLFTAHGPRHSSVAAVTVTAPGGINYGSANGLELFENPGELISFAPPSPMGFDYSSHWVGSAAPSITALLHVYTQTKSNEGFTTAVTRYGSTPITMTDGVTSFPQVALGGAPATIGLSGTISYPAGDLRRLSQLMQSGGGTWHLAQGALYPPGSFALIAPNLFNARYAVCATATYSTGWYDPPFSIACRGGLSSTQTTGLAIDAPPYGDAVEPGPDIVASIQGTYTWTTPVGGVSMLHVAAQVVAQPSVFVILSGTTYTVPDLSAYGFPAVAAGTNYGWRVRTYPGLASVDAAADPNAPLAAVWYSGPDGLRGRIDANAAMTKTETRFITTP